MQKLKLGAVDAAMDDSPVAAYYVKQDPASFAIAGKPIAQAPEGFAVDPKNQELLKAIQQAMQAIFNDGSYQKILDQWNQGSLAPAPMRTGRPQRVKDGALQFGDRAEEAEPARSKVPAPFIG